MDDLSNISFLVGKPGDQKFKRNVPERLKKLAGKTAFVERVKSSRASEIKEQGRLFAVRTDAEIRRFDGLLAAGEFVPEARVPKLELSYTRARQIAFSYFVQRDRENLERGDYFASPADPNFADLLSDAGDESADALRQASGEYRTTPPRALTILVRHGVVASSVAEQILQSGWRSELLGHRDFHFFCRLIERADVELADRRYHSLNRGSLVPIKDQMFWSAEREDVRSSHGTKALSKTVADLKDFFLSTKIGNVTRSRAAQYRIPFRALEEHFGPSFLLSKIGRDECRALLEFLPRIPSHVTQHYKKLPLKAAAEEHRSKHGAYAERHGEAQKHVQILRSAFDCAVNEHWLERNPFSGLKIEEPKARRKKHLSAENTYDPFTVEQLNLLFALPLFTGCQDDERKCHTPGSKIIRRHRYWAPILALWTGMRMNEILQLEKADIRTTDNGIRYISVTDEDHQDYSGTGFSKRLKTGNALRNIPIHPKLIDFGFVDWADQRSDGRLFPEAVSGKGEKPSDTYSKRFASNLKAAGIWQPRRLVFHSFRNSFNDALRHAGVSLELREAINGWRAQKSMDASYGRGQKLETLHSAVSRIAYPGLEVAHLIAQEPLAPR